MLYSRYGGSRTICAAADTSAVPAALVPTRWRSSGQPPHTLPQNSQIGGCSRASRRVNCNISAAVSHFLPTDAIVAVSSGDKPDGDDNGDNNNNPQSFVMLFVDERLIFVFNSAFA